MKAAVVSSDTDSKWTIWTVNDTNTQMYALEMNGLRGDLDMTIIGPA